MTAWHLPVAAPLHPNDWERPAGNLDFRVTQTFAHVNLSVSKLPHGALDIGNTRLGYPVYASRAGRVVAVGNLGWPWSEPTKLFASGNWGGLMVVADAGDGDVLLYCHLRAALVTAGQTIAAGQRIGSIGDSGSAVGQGHLHFEVRRRGVKVDPWPLLTQPQGGDDVILPAGWHPVYNRHCRILAAADRRVNVRWEVADAEPLPDNTKAVTFDHQEWFTVRGYADTKLGRWYGGELWIDGGWKWCYVFAALCGPLVPIEAPPALDCKAEVAEALEAAAKRVLAP